MPVSYNSYQMTKLKELTKNGNILFGVYRQSVDRGGNMFVYGKWHNPLVA
jgi:hypothetical protein